MTKETFIPRSTNLAQVEYDTDARELTVTFQSGDAWVYSNVPVTVFQGIQHAPSAGSYFYRNIRSVYSGEEI